ALVRRLVTQVEILAKKEIELCKTELRTDLHQEARAAGGLGIAAVGGIITVALLLVTVILALSLVMPAWGAGLIVSGATLTATVVLALVSWSRRVRDQLRRHPVPISLVAAALLALAAGGVALAVTRRRRRQRLPARLERLREALGRMVAKPNRVATDPGVGRKIAAAAGAAAASLTAKKLVAKAFRE